MAGNIIPAIATTNAIIAGMIVLQAIQILTSEMSGCKDVKRRLEIMFKEFLSTLNPNSSLIIRTASKYSTVEEVKEDYLKVCNLWNFIKNTAKKKD